jgi:hypothetical protein
MCAQHSDSNWKYNLHEWKFKTTRNGYIYCVGKLDDGTDWETSHVVSMDTLRDGYRVVTNHSVYYLWWY